MAEQSTQNDEFILDDNENILKEGYIFDFISGKPVKAGPEEVSATQPYSMTLVNDYGYSKEQIRTRPQFRVKHSPSDKNGTYPLDIAVFNNKEQKEEDLYIIVECKKPTETDGVKQLKDYLTLSTATIGVWFNGKDAPVYIRKIIKDGGVVFEKIPNIPKNGERIEDIGQFKRNQLTQPHNLKGIFKILRNHLAGNAVGTTRDEELARQLINLIFTKIYDEKFKAHEDKVDFRAGVNEPVADVKKRIEDLFKLVKTKYKDVIDVSETINLDAESLYFAVGQLQNYCLIEAERDVIADAFETFIGYALKGPQGQFFTPRNIVSLMVEILNQSPDETVIDPSCGSGGFIVESLRHVWNVLSDEGKRLNWPAKALEEEKTKAAISKIHGIEKDTFLSKVAKAYMAILGDGKGGIFCEDTLNLPTNWGRNTQQSIKLDSFDCLLANPPFGKEIKVIGTDKLSQFDLAYKWKKEKNLWSKTDKLNDDMPPQILFVERSIDLLADKGRMGLIIPETYFHAPNSQYVMNFMAQHNIYCLIDLPHNTFRPHNNAKCIAVFLEKNVPQQDKIMMCVAEEIGHDHQGKEKYRWDDITKKSTNVLWDDTLLIKDEINALKSTLQGAEYNIKTKGGNWINDLVSSKKSKDQKYVFFIDSSVVKTKMVYVPRYYWQQKQNELQQKAQKADSKLITMDYLIKNKIVTFFDGHGSPESENKGKGEVPYVRVKDIVNWEVYKDPTSLIPMNVYNDMKKEGKDLLEGDILYVRRGSYRIGSVAMVSPFDKDVLLTREILVLRVAQNNKLGITPFYLLYLLSHWITQEQSKNKILIETTLPNIANRWQELALPVHNDPKKIAEVSKKIEDAIKQKWGAVSKIKDVVKEFGNLTT